MSDVIKVNFREHKREDDEKNSSDNVVMDVNQIPYPDFIENAKKTRRSVRMWIELRDDKYKESISEFKESELAGYLLQISAEYNLYLSEFDLLNAKKGKLTENSRTELLILLRREIQAGG